ncbi:MAG: hypothetical protein WA965_28790 [Mycobacterium sp.]
MTRSSGSAAPPRAGDFADARAGCRELDGQVEALDAKLPAPSMELTAHLQEAVEQFGLFARQCQGLNPSTTSAELDRMTSFRVLGEDAMERAVSIVSTARLNG